MMPGMPCRLLEAQPNTNQNLGDTMTKQIRIASALHTTPHHPRKAVRTHKLPLCRPTGLARYRDRHQAKQAATSMRAGNTKHRYTTWACPECRGYHLEKFDPVHLDHLNNHKAPKPSPSPKHKTGRYLLVDIENLTHGARLTREEVNLLWQALAKDTLDLTDQDHIVIGAARRITRKYRPAIQAPNVKWVVGTNAPDGADNALLAAIDLYQVAKQYHELVILSGDHVFSGLARRAKTMGLNVHVVNTARPDSRAMLSRELSATADTRTLVRFQPNGTPRDYPVSVQKVSTWTPTPIPGTTAA